MNVMKFILQVIFLENKALHEEILLYSLDLFFHKEFPLSQLVKLLVWGHIRMRYSTIS